jgi:glycine oxidase
MTFPQLSRLDPQRREIIIIGGGLMGMAIALHLKTQGVAVTVLRRSPTEAAGYAAAGMLAPEAEGLEPGPMRELCLRSRDRYATWSQEIEALTGESIGYWPCGILAPSYGGETPHAMASHRTREDLLQLQPGLSPEVRGGWWFPKDGQVDNRLLMAALQKGLDMLGVEQINGVTVERLVIDGDRVTGLNTSRGLWQGSHYVLATGAWSQDLLPVPVVPRKGQLLALQATEKTLNQVLFGGEIYLVPRENGRLIVGATSEDVGFAQGNTAAGIEQLLRATRRLVPGLGDLAIESFWWGFRPATPDELPILGPGPQKNLTLATGHYRNGVLLTPITAEVIGDVVMGRSARLDLTPFHWSRFVNNGDASS